MTRPEDIANIDAIADVLLQYGKRHHGGRAREIAREWHEYDFDAASVTSWCDAGVWDAETARAFLDAELWPDEICAAADRLVAENGADAYTDGCPIYAACNGDLDPQRIIDAHYNG